MDGDIMYCTGNEYISLPEIAEDGSSASFNCLSMAHKGIIEFRGKPGIGVKVLVDGEPAKLAFDSMDRFWIPRFSFRAGRVSGTLSIFAPKGKKGFAYSFEFDNAGCDPARVEVTVTSDFSDVLHTVNESKRFCGETNCYISAWDKAPVFDLRIGFPVLAVSAGSDHEDTSWSLLKCGYEGSSCIDLGASGKEGIAFFWGLGFEDISAVTAVRDMVRLTVKGMYSSTVKYLETVVRHSDDKALEATLNTNLLFCLFYATGYTYDTEEFVAVTSRSPRYYVSAAYWDRDSLLWAFPAICNADRAVADEMLAYSMGRQLRNLGTHSRYIDGTLLEPGFELDELCAPIIAVDFYARHFNDRSVWERDYVKACASKVLNELEQHRGETGLYETFLQPSDDEVRYSYLTYDNVLALKVFEILGLEARRADLEKAIEEHCIGTIDGVRQYVWGTDGLGEYEIYDEPPGSLLLIPCFHADYDREAYGNTVRRIEDSSYRFSFSGYPFGAIGCAHAPHPWVLSLANKIRVFHDRDSFRKLTTAPMDHHIASESIDENTGVSTTGEAFATCAGYVAYVLMMELSNDR